MAATEWYVLALRLAHALASVVWLGGGVYYLVALRPAMQEMGEQGAPVASAAQRQFGEWARVCTLAMIATGVVLIFERLSATGGEFNYVALLSAKVLAALAAFWFAGFRPAGRRGRAGGRRTKPELVLALGAFAFAAGVALSEAWGDR